MRERPDPDAVAIVHWWTVNARELPWRVRRDVYAVWVSEVMSAQTTVGRAAEAWSRWMERWPTVDALAEVDRAAAETLVADGLVRFVNGTVRPPR